MSLWRLRRRPKGRPKKSSYQTYQLLYARLLKGSLWLSDWKSTKLGSRTTVHVGLKSLESQGLVTTRRDGHKILYEIVPLQNDEGVITKEFIKWLGLLYRTTRKDLRHIRRRGKKAAQELAEAQRQLQIGTLAMIKLEEEIDKFLEAPENKAVLRMLMRANFDWRELPTINLIKALLLPNLSRTLCHSCLEKGLLTYLIEDHETGEIICPREGTVVEEKIPFQTFRPKGERPSPFKPDKD